MLRNHYKNISLSIIVSLFPIVRIALTFDKFHLLINFHISFFQVPVAFLSKIVQITL